MLDSSGKITVQFAFLTAASAQSGTHRPEQVFCLLHVRSRAPNCGPGAFSGLTLELSTSEYIAPTGSIYLPQQPEAFGSLKMFTSDEFAEYLLDMPTIADPACHAMKVHITVLAFEDFLPSVVKVTGNELVSVGDFGSANVDNADAVMDSEDQGPMPPISGDVSVESMDLLSLLQDSVEPAPKRARKQTNRKKQAMWAC